MSSTRPPVAPASSWHPVPATRHTQTSSTPGSPRRWRHWSSAASTRTFTAARTRRQATAGRNGPRSVLAVCRLPPADYPLIGELAYLLLADAQFAQHLRRVLAQQ